MDNLISRIIIESETVRDNGGFTIAMDNSAGPFVGYAVSVRGCEARVDIATFSWRTTMLYVALHTEALAQEGAMLGAWVDNSFVYLDVTRFYFTTEEAVEAARAGAQLAYFDFQTMQSVYLDKA
jgi:hypothetical protein